MVTHLNPATAEEQIAVLQHLSRNVRGTLSNIARATDFDDAYAEERLLELAQQGYVRRTPGAGGRWEITYNGRNVLKERGLE